MARPETDIDGLIASVKGEFPFEGYLADNGESLRVFGSLLDRHCPNRGRLLDIGCGAIDRLALFQHMGFESYGVDDFQDPWHREDDNLERLMAFAQRMDLRIHITRDNDPSLPWEPKSFDVVRCST